MSLNAGILILSDGTPCIAIDDLMEKSIKAVEVDADTSMVKLIYRPSWSLKQEEKELDYPLDYDFRELLAFCKYVAIAYVHGGKAIDLKEVPVVFTGMTEHRLAV